MRILVCGAGGQVGRELVERASRFGLDVLAPARAQLDIAKPEQVADAMRQRPELIINAAAYTHVDNAESHGEQAYAVNRDGPRHLAEAAKHAGVPLFHISTDYVFSGEATRPYTESDETGPTGVYGASKLAGEEAIRSCLPAHLILRTSWVYGVHGHNFVKTMLRLARQRDALGGERPDRLSDSGRQHRLGAARAGPALCGRCGTRLGRLPLQRRACLLLVRLRGGNLPSR